MKFTPLAALLLVAGAASPALADAHSETSAAALTVNSPIASLMADEAAKAVVLKHLPGLDQHPAYEDFKTMSLLALKPWSQGQITDEIIANITTELGALS